MISLSIETKGKFPVIRQAIARALPVAAQIVRGKAIGNAPYKTGTLRRSIITDVNPNRAKIGTNLDYARIQEFGGTIRPKKKKMLAFKIGGKWVFAKKVTLPARPYLVPALFSSEEQIKRVFKAEIEKTSA